MKKCSGNGKMIVCVYTQTNVAFCILRLVGCRTFCGAARCVMVRCILWCGFVWCCAYCGVARCVAVHIAVLLFVVRCILHCGSLCCSAVYIAVRLCVVRKVVVIGGYCRDRPRRLIGGQLGPVCSAHCGVAQTA